MNTPTFSTEMDFHSTKVQKIRENSLLYILVAGKFNLKWRVV